MAAVCQVLEALEAPFDFETAARRHGRHPAVRRPAAPGHAGQHPPHPAGAQGPAGHADRRRLPLGQRPTARGVPALRQRAARAHARARRPLRGHRPGARAREPGGPLRRHRALHLDRRRRARRGARLRPEHARRVPTHRRLRLRVRAQARPQEGHDRPQGEHPQGADRPVPRNGARRRARSTRADSSSTTASSTPAPCSWCSTRGSST